MNNHEYAITIKDSQQISPDDFRTFYRTVKADDNTTLGEIRKWYKMYFPKHKLTGIQITELENTEFNNE